MPRDWMRHRLWAMSECVHLLCAGLGSTLNAVIRFPFALLFGWPDPSEHQQAQAALLAQQVAELSQAAEAKARSKSEPSDK